MKFNHIHWACLCPPYQLCNVLNFFIHVANENAKTFIICVISFIQKFSEFWGIGRWWLIAGGYFNCHSVCKLTYFQKFQEFTLNNVIFKIIILFWLINSSPRGRTPIRIGFMYCEGAEGLFADTRLKPRFSYWSEDKIAVYRVLVMDLCRELIITLHCFLVFNLTVSLCLKNQ